jgi:hypothetical protein
MKVLLNKAIVAAMVCHAQVYSINGIPVLSPNERPGEVRVTTYTSTVGDRSTSVEWCISTNVLAKQPRWDGFSTESPLSVRSACVLALSAVTNRFPQVLSWSVQSVSLTNPYTEKGERYTNVWYYDIVFTPRDSVLQKQMEGEEPWMCQIVLLDGTVVPPRQIAE